MALMNLLFVSSYSDLGGGETALVTLARSLDPARFLPHLLVPRTGQLSERWQSLGWPVHVTPWRGANVYFIPALWAQFPAARQMEAIIREQKIHAVHAEYHSLPFALPAATRAGVPLLWTCMGWWFHPRLWQRGFFRRPLAAFAHSQAIKDGFLGQPPFMPPERIEVLYPGVDTQRFHPGVDGVKVRFDANIAQDAPVVAMIARFQDVKGHDVFQAMAKQVVLQIPEARFIVAGENTQTSADDSYKARIIQAARQTSLLRKRLSYLGFRSDVERVIGAADVVVCASRFEGYGVVNIEAMACGKPVVSTNQGGPSETIVDGETGYLVPAGDAAALASRVIDLLHDASLRAKMGAAGREHVLRHFSMESNGAQFTRALDAILSS
ncbi:MAG: glycosyltransferase family 4 protein [Anaerolineae bacterium]|nr:glycosyltransferase family 4 protein [Anaerolineae bacterium]